MNKLEKCESCETKIKFKLTQNKPIVLHKNLKL